jgi:RHS repeat-associated protein
VVYEKSWAVSGAALTPQGDKIYSTAGGKMAVTRQTVNGTATTTYYGTDHLGTVRATVTVDAAGAEQYRTFHDYEPFGLELPVRDTVSPNTHRFTGHERDAETANDFMHARYYGSSLGRFMRPDVIPGTQGDPQSWNLYAYVRNAPANLNDPTGHIWNNGFIGTDENQHPGAYPDNGETPLSSAGLLPEGMGTIGSESPWRLPDLFRDRGIDAGRGSSWYNPGTGHSLWPGLSFKYSYPVVSNTSTSSRNPLGQYRFSVHATYALVTAYIDKSQNTAHNTIPGIGTVATANSKPKPYSFDTFVIIFNPTAGDEPSTYAGSIVDTGAGWNSTHHDVPAANWFDIWLPTRAEAMAWGKRWCLVFVFEH